MRCSNYSKIFQNQRRQALWFTCFSARMARADMPQPPIPTKWSHSFWLIELTDSGTFSSVHAFEIELLPLSSLNAAVEFRLWCGSHRKYFFLRIMWGWVLHFPRKFAGKFRDSDGEIVGNIIFRVIFAGSVGFALDDSEVVELHKWAGRFFGPPSLLISDRTSEISLYVICRSKSW